MARKSQARVDLPEQGLLCQYITDGKWNSLKENLTPANAESSDSENRTLLMLAVRSGHKNSKETVEHLIECGANVNAVDKFENSVLHHACMAANADAVRILLKQGADSAALNSNKQMPIELALIKSLFPAKVDDGVLKTVKVYKSMCSSEAQRAIQRFDAMFHRKAKESGFLRTATEFNKAADSPAKPSTHEAFIDKRVCDLEALVRQLEEENRNLREEIYKLSKSNEQTVKVVKELFVEAMGPSGKTMDERFAKQERKMDEIQASHRADIAEVKETLTDEIRKLSLQFQDTFKRNQLELEMRINELTKENEELRASAGLKQDTFKVTQPLGLCLIINNMNYKQTELIRKGSDKDVAKIEEVFKKIGFEIITEKDLTAEAMLDCIGEFRKDKRHSEYGMAVVFIMAHGQANSVFGIDGEAVEVQAMTDPLNYCANLKHKPKVIFIQACRKPAEALTPRSNSKVADDDFRLPLDAYKSSKADFMFNYSNTEDSVAYRDMLKGSPFIQKMCEKIEELYEKADLMSIATEVSRELREWVDDRDDIVGKIVMEIRSTLSHKVVLSPKLEWHTEVSNENTEDSVEYPDDFEPK